MERTYETNMVKTEWQPDKDDMVLVLQVGTWSTSKIKFSKPHIQRITNQFQEWLKGGDTNLSK